ncbi:CPCC family cysteine-rich protein [Winogradskyella aquimaris]|uniref:CPCC family cysteine-rich protein n=1 Tax=Winogradskyella aquimaris TaxID=864074 RepID=A0ABU5ER33_9FLAO|nr:CPCC family cysteine-rich protein [Winogradskyella aquimaris]MDY2588532.1 CPCC family cysteine-rich protein [Winogradskyella aquimaris]
MTEPLKIDKPHIKLHKIDGQLVLDIDTWELKDIIEDYLREECDIDYEYYHDLNPELAQTNYESYRLFFSDSYSENQITDVLKKYSDKELIEIVEFQRSQANGRFYCECCGYNTLNEKPNGTYQICTTCYWEDDPIQSAEPDYEGGANRVSLNQAKRNFAEFGACERDMIKNVNKVHKDDIRNPKYKLK